MKVALSVALIATALPISARAAVYSDDLSKCLVSHTSDTEKNGLIKWLFASIAAHPAVREMANVSPAKRAEYDKDFAELMQQLVTVRCRKESVAALKYEGVGTFQSSFGVLGQVAMRGLMSNPAVTVQMQQIGNFLDKKAMADLFKEAGLPTNESKSDVQP